MCNNHHGLCDGFHFFICFLPDVSVICLCFESCIHKKQIHEFVFINYSKNPFLQNVHGRAIALNIMDHHAPFPSLLIIHEMCIHGFHPFAPLNPVMRGRKHTDIYLLYWGIALLTLVARVGNLSCWFKVVALAVHFWSQVMTFLLEYFVPCHHIMGVIGQDSRSIRTIQ